MCLQTKPLQELSGFTLETLHAARRHHLSRGCCGDMQPQHFRKFMGYLLQGVQYRWVTFTCWGMLPVYWTQLLLLAVGVCLVLQDLSFVRETQSRCRLLNFLQIGILSIECSDPLSARRIVDRLHSFGSTGLTLFGVSQDMWHKIYPFQHLHLFMVLQKWKLCFAT